VSFFVSQTTTLRNEQLCSLRVYTDLLQGTGYQLFNGSECGVVRQSSVVIPYHRKSERDEVVASDLSSHVVPVTTLVRVAVLTHQIIVSDVIPTCMPFTRIYRHLLAIRHVVQQQQPLLVLIRTRLPFNRRRTTRKLDT